MPISPTQDPTPPQAQQPQLRPQGVGADWRLLDAGSGNKVWFSPDQAKIGVSRGAKDITPEATSSQTSQPTVTAKPKGKGFLPMITEGAENFGKGIAHSGLQTVDSLDNTSFGRWLNNYGGLDKGNAEKILADDRRQQNAVKPEPGIAGNLGGMVEQGAEMLGGSGEGKLGLKLAEMGLRGGLSSAVHGQNIPAGVATGAGGELLGPVGSYLKDTAPGKIVGGALRAGKSRFLNSEPAKQLVDSGIVSMTAKGAAKKAGKQIASNLDGVTAALAKAGESGKRVNASRATTEPFEEEANKLENSGFNQAAQQVHDHLQRILDFYGPNGPAAKAVLSSLSPQDANFLKTERLQAIPKYSTASLMPGGEEGSPIREAGKQAASRVRKSMEEAIPDIAGPNKRAHNLIEAKEALEEREKADAARGWRPTLPEMLIPAAVGGFGHSLPAALAAYGITKAGESVPAALLAGQASRQAGRFLANPTLRRGTTGAVMHLTMPPPNRRF